MFGRRFSIEAAALVGPNDLQGLERSVNEEFETPSKCLSIALGT